jgi:hypothetical protein
MKKKQEIKMKVSLALMIRDFKDNYLDWKGKINGKPQVELFLMMEK